MDQALLERDLRRRRPSRHAARDVRQSTTSGKAATECCGTTRTDSRGSRSSSTGSEPTAREDRYLGRVHEMRRSSGGRPDRRPHDQGARRQTDPPGRTGTRRSTSTTASHPRDAGGCSCAWPATSLLAYRPDLVKVRLRLRDPLAGGGDPARSVLGWRGHAPQLPRGGGRCDARGVARSRGDVLPPVSAVQRPDRPALTGRSVGVASATTAGLGEPACVLREVPRRDGHPVLQLERLRLWLAAAGHLVRRSVARPRRCARQRCGGDPLGGVPTPRRRRQVQRGVLVGSSTEAV
jgi:hypothetical protein